MPSTLTPSLRTLACVFVLVSLAACDRTPPSDKTAVSATSPEEIPAASAVPAPEAGTSALILPFFSDDARIGTEVGERSVGLGMSTTGKAGWLVFGPYIPLPAGNYQVEFKGAVHEGHAGVVHLDVAQGKGTDVIAEAEVEAPALLSPPSPDGLAVLPFTLKESSSDLEFRVRVTEAANLSISGYVIRSVP